MNDLIGNNTTLEKSLTTENEIRQMDQRIALKDLAKETMEMQTKLEEQKAERDYALKHMNELEHHVMLWRYKISFEIQTQVQICIASIILHVRLTCFYQDQSLPNVE